MAVLLVWGGILLAEKLIEMRNEQNEAQRRSLSIASERRRQRGSDEWQMAQPRLLANEERSAWAGPPPPPDYIDPITLDLMEEPVIIETGQTFDRDSITAWFARGRRSCPLTNRQLSTTATTPNVRLKREIAAWKAEQVKEMATPESIDEVIAKVRREALLTAGSSLARCDSGCSPQAQRELRRRNTVEVRDMAGALDISFDQLNSDAMLRNLLALLPGPVGGTAAGVLEYVAAADAADKLRVVGAGALPVLGGMLGPGSSSDNKVQAAGLLATLCDDPTIKLHVISAGLPATLVGLLEDPDPEVVIKAAAALKALVSNAGASTLLSCADLLPPLSALVDSQGSPAQGYAAEVLGYMAMNDELAATLAEQGTIPTLVTLLSSPSRRVLEKAVFAVFALAMHSVALPRLYDAGCMPPLVAALESGTLAAQTYAAGALMYLACHMTARTALAASAAVPPLVKLLAAPSRRCNAYAAGTLSCLGEDPQVAVAIGARGGLPPLVRVLSCEDAWVQEIAIDCACTVMRTCVANQRRFLDAGGLKLLTRLLVEHRVSTYAMTSGVTCIRLLSSFRAVRESLVYCPEFMSVLQGLGRHSDDDLRSAARRALAALAHETHMLMMPSHHHPLF